LAVRIDRLLDPAKALREAMEARIEKAEDGPPGLWVWREAGDQEASRLRLSKARDAFNDRLGTMKAAKVDLEDAGYAGAPRPAKMRYIYDRNSPHFLQWALDDGHEPGPTEIAYMYEAAGNSRNGPPGMVAEAVDLLRDLEQALLKTREWLKAQKPPKRKRKRASDKPRKPRPLTPWQAEVTQIVGECKGNIAQAAKRLGRDPSTIRESYKAAMTKLGKEVVRSRDKTRLFARDKRGNEMVSAEDDRRR
jgi:hypothetical protein